MQNQNIVFIALAFALAFALAPVTKAAPRPDGGPSPAPTPAGEQPHPDGGPVPASTPGNEAPAPIQLPPPAPRPEDVEFPVITIHSAGDVSRGKTGSFVLGMDPVVMFGGTYVNFSVSGTAVAGVDYVPLLSPAYIGQPGYGVILLKTLPDPRGSFNRQAYTVVVTLEPGAGYAVGEPSSVEIWIQPSP